MPSGKDYNLLLSYYKLELQSDCAKLFYFRAVSPIVTKNRLHERRIF